MSNSTVDKDELYGRYHRAEDWQSRLYRRAAHKSLDIPDEDMQIYSDNRRTGDFTFKTLAMLMLGGLLGGGGLLAGQLLNKAPEVVERVQQARQDVEIGLGRIEDYTQ